MNTFNGSAGNQISSSSPARVESGLQTVPLADLDPPSLITRLAGSHRCSYHPLFDALTAVPLNEDRIAEFLRNYDAHASHLRRLLLNVAAIMPEEVVCYVLENVRNEYGNGKPDKRHQLQLIDLAEKCGVERSRFDRSRVRPGIRQFIQDVTPFYLPLKGMRSGTEESMDVRRGQAVSAGAVTATELLAIKEFKYMQTAFARLGQSGHIWFDHVTVEEEHSEESLALALYFVEKHECLEDVITGLNGVLDANMHLYDGLLECLA